MSGCPITFSRKHSFGVFALLQCVLFVLIGNYILEIRGMFWIYLGIVLMTAMGGVALGLVVSSLVADPKTAANIVPLVLIPQIIMGGALIKYEDMNRNLALVYTFTRWFSEHPNKEQGKKWTANCRCHSSASSSPCAGPTRRWLWRRPN
jgi:ABC-type multidrug transport system permease subunit